MTLQERLPPGKYRLRVEDYEMLAEAGAFGEARTELIEGEVFVVNSQFRPHAMVKMRLYDALRERLIAIGSSLCPIIEVSIALSAHSMPDPDIVLTSEPDGLKAVPLSSVGLLIEVSDTTLRDDLTTKLHLYARQQVPEYWVADVAGRIIHRMSRPAGDTYTDRAEIAFGEPIASATIENLTIATNAL